VAQHLGWNLGGIEPEQVWASIGEMPGPYHEVGWREWKAIGSEGATAEEIRAASREPRRDDDRDRDKDEDCREALKRARAAGADR
jgi:hypothetical protein